MNTASRGYSAVCGGDQNTASGDVSIVGGGGENQASGIYSTVGGGLNNKASGSYSTVGGSHNHAGGNYSWAGGRYMQLTAAAEHSFVWGYSETPQYLIAPDAFLIFPGHSEGKVGVGIDIPRYLLHVHKNSSHHAYMTFTNTVTGSGSLDGVLVGLDPNENFRIHSYESNNLLFYIDNDEKVRIASSGNVGIGTNDPGYKLEVIGNAAKSSGGTSWSVSSDMRLKDITAEYEQGLAAITSLRPITFYYKNGNLRDLPSDEENVGFIAQEVQEVFPEAVSEGPDGYLDFNMHPVNVAVVNAIKELKAENDEIRSENKSLKAENAVLKKDLEKIKKILGI